MRLCLSPREGESKRAREECRDQVPGLCASVCVCVPAWCEREKGLGNEPSSDSIRPQTCGQGGRGWHGGEEWQGVEPAEL